LKNELKLELSKKKQGNKVMDKIKISSNRNFGLVFFIVFLEKDSKILFGFGTL
jgi:hypothetical protein